MYVTEEVVRHDQDWREIENSKRRMILSLT